MVDQGIILIRQPLTKPKNIFVKDPELGVLAVLCLVVQNKEVGRNGHVETIKIQEDAELPAGWRPMLPTTEPAIDIDRQNPFGVPGDDGVVGAKPDSRRSACS